MNVPTSMYGRWGTRAAFSSGQYNSSLREEITFPSSSRQREETASDLAIAPRATNTRRRSSSSNTSSGLLRWAVGAEVAVKDAGVEGRCVEEVVAMAECRGRLDRDRELLTNFYTASVQQCTQVITPHRNTHAVCYRHKHQLVRDHREECREEII